MEAAAKKGLSLEEKRHALRNDVVQWTKAKSRIHHGVPKAREYIHRSIWALGAPERKNLEALHKNYIEPHIPFPQMDKVLEQLEIMQKNRQVVYAHGMTVYQECKNIFTEVQGALRTLQRNAAANSNKKKHAAAAKGKFFQDIRRMSGTD